MRTKNPSVQKLYKQLSVVPPSQRQEVRAIFKERELTNMKSIFLAAREVQSKCRGLKHWGQESQDPSEYAHQWIRPKKQMGLYLLKANALKHGLTEKECSLFFRLVRIAQLDVQVELIDSNKSHQTTNRAKRLLDLNSSTFRHMVPKINCIHEELVKYLKNELIKSEVHDLTLKELPELGIGIHAWAYSHIAFLGAEYANSVINSIQAYMKHQLK